MRGYPNANFANGANGRKLPPLSFRTPPLVIPNTVRNPAPVKGRDSSLRSE